MLQRMGIISAITISSLIFSLLHAFGSGLYAAIAIFIQTTFVLTVPYLLTKNLWFSIGIHFGWNFFQSGIFSYLIGDQNLSKGLFLIQVKEPVWLFGSASGIGTSIFAILSCAIAGIMLFYFWQKNKLSQKFNNLN